MQKIWLFLIFLPLIISPAYGKNFSDQVQKTVKESIDIRQETQKKRERWHKEYLNLIQKYKDLLNQIKDLEAKNKELKVKKTDLKGKIKNYQEEISKLDSISSQMLPFLKKVYMALEEMVKKDLPFLREERKRRLNILKEVIEGSNFSLAEKYRKVMEALFIEAEYGNTIEVYQDRININGKKIEGNVFRLGRVALFFQSPDRKISAIFDPSTSSWKTLPRRYTNDITAAIEIAKRRRPVELLILPIGRIKLKK